MRHFPLKTLILCILLPPVVHMASIHLIEKWTQVRYTDQWRQMCVGDSELLLDGSLRLRDVISENTDAFLASRTLPRWGARIQVTVTSADGTTFYPRAYDAPMTAMAGGDGITVARDNFKLLNDGLLCRIDVSIPPNTPISNVVLSFYIAVALLVLFGAYRRWTVNSRVDVLANQAMIEELARARQESLSQLARLKTQRNDLNDKIEVIQKERLKEKQAATNAEDQLIDEMVALEDKISAQLKVQDRQNQEIEALKHQINAYEQIDAGKTQFRGNRLNGVRKRFNSLYKATTLHDRAIEGFANLTEEMKIKAEEVVHQLNADAALVSIKRKVFGKKNSATIFEVIFGYKGRLYFRNIKCR